MRIKDMYENKKVYITGITGFKGSWFALLLTKLGADVKGFGLAQTDPETIFVKGKVSEICDVSIYDLRDKMPTKIENDIKNSDYIFHLAAQPIVSEGYRDPYGTFDTNLMGTVKMLELIKNETKPTTFLSVASDRVYASVGHAHLESDPLEAHDPYSMSKVFDNMLVDMYADMDRVSNSVRFINARASNVLGGGDKGVNRIVTSIINAHKNNEVLKLRNPDFVRPYIYVLDCLLEYLMIAAWGKENAYNIGAGKETTVSVKALVESFQKNGYNNLTYNNTGEKFGFEGNELLVNTDLFHNEFPGIQSVCNTIDDIVVRTQKINLSNDDKNNLNIINELIDEAIDIYSQFDF